MSVRRLLKRIFIEITERGDEIKLVNRPDVKKIILGMGLSMCISLVGCSGNVNNNTNNETQTIESVEAADYMTTDGYMSISQIAEDYELSFEYVGNNGEIQSTGDVYSNKIFTGKYCLDNESKYKIVVADYEFSSDSYIEINGVKKQINVEHIEKVGIVDIDTNDNYKEIVLYDLGASADPTLRLIRFCDGEIHELGSYISVGDYESILFNAKGNIIDKTGYVDFIDTKIVTEYYVIGNGDIVVVHIDYKNALNKTYKVSKDIAVAFCESTDGNWANVSMNIDNTISLKAGEEIKLINIQEYDVYYIQLPDGRTSFISTQLAG